jgi:hypothetical protein
VAIEFLQESDEFITSRQAVELFREILNDPTFKEGTFQNLVTLGEIKSINPEERIRLYPRSDVIRLAEERKEMRSLLSPKQVAERAALRGITISDREIVRMVEDGRLPKHRKFRRRYFFRPEDADRAINLAVKKIKMAEQINGLRSPRQSVAWINARLEEQGREERIDLDRFYSWCRGERQVIEPDYKTPYGARGDIRRFYFSEDTLLKAPVFRERTETMQNRPEPVHVTNSKKLIELEQKWGELLIRDGIEEEGLSIHAVNRKDRKVFPVGYVGNVQWFPKRYIPQKIKRRPNRRDIVQQAVSD